MDRASRPLPDDARAPTPRWLPLRSALGLFVLGAGLHLAYLGILFAHPASRRNLHPPEGAFQDNLWAGSDVMSYVEPARNFLGHGVFGSGTAPDAHRTFGYPFFLASLMRLFGEQWLVVAVVVQCLAAAVVYPVLWDLSGLLFPSRRGTAVAALVFLVLSGTYVATAPVLLTDLPFAILFTLGLRLGIAGVARGSLPRLVMQVVALGAAAQVRPTLVLYPVVHAVVMVAAARMHGVLGAARTRRAIVVSLLLLGLLCQGPSIRNYMNHGYFHPSDALEVNLFKQLARRVLAERGEQARFRELQARVEAEQGFEGRTRRQRELALTVLREHPADAVKQLALQAMAILGNSHWLKAAQFWGISWRERTDRTPLRASAVALALNVAAYAAYGVVYLLFVARLVRSFRRGEWLCGLAPLLLVSYFLLPSFLDAAGSRLRLPVEGLLVVYAADEFVRRWHGRLPE